MSICDFYFRRLQCGSRRNSLAALNEGIDPLREYGSRGRQALVQRLLYIFNRHFMMLATSCNAVLIAQTCAHISRNALRMTRPVNNQNRRPHLLSSVP